MKTPKIRLKNEALIPKGSMPKAPKMRSPVYTPSWKQMNKGSFVSVPKFPKIKIKSDYS